ncbi:hypothetical protein DBR06_SOUSAS27710009, partial [Sousa chinensis]
PPSHEHVTDQDDGEGHREEQAQHDGAVGHEVAEELGCRGVMAGNAATTCTGGDEVKHGCLAGQHQHPHGDGHPAGVAGPAPAQRAQWTQDTQASVHADAREEEDAAVKVGVEEEAHQLAEHCAEGPVVTAGVVIDQQGQ